VPVSSPLQDPYWKEVAAFIETNLGFDAPLIAPREFIPYFPKTLPYELSASALGLLSKYRGAAIHKGLLHEPSLDVLKLFASDWRPVFANGVFVFFVPPESPLPKSDSIHIAAFFTNLEIIKTNFLINQPRPPLTALWVSATREPSFLDATLDSLSGFGLPVLVMDGSGSVPFSKSYSELCRRHSTACVIHFTPEYSSKEQKWREGWANWEQTEWLSFFQDGAVARPDLMLAMHHFQHAVSHPALSGFWEPSCGEKSSLYRDGYRLVSPVHPPRVHLHLHRSHWKKNISVLFGKKEPLFGKSRFPLQAKSLSLRSIPGLVWMKS
jgi:hypothetical protein